MDDLSRISALKLWIPAISMMLVSLISYIDRNTLALLAPTILAETRLSAEQYGWIVSAFSILYMLGNFVWGRWLDRFGLRFGMLAAVGFWTLASVSHAFAVGFWSFALARAALGFGEGATFPGGLRAAMQTLPAHLRARGIAVAYSGGSLGAIITPIMVTPIAVLWGWRGAFWFTGLVGFLWIVHWLMVGRRPELTQASYVSKRTETLPHPTWGDPRLWSYIAAYAFGALPLGFILYNTSLYLSRALSKSQVEIGHVLWIPPAGWEVGYFFWGWVIDRAFNRGEQTIEGYRRLFGILTLLSLPLAAAPFITSYWLLMTNLFVEMFVTAGFVMIAVAYATFIYSSRHSGFIAGVGAGSWSAVVGMVMPMVGRLFDQQQYRTAFVVATCFPVLGYSAWLWLNRRDHAA